MRTSAGLLQAAIIPTILAMVGVETCKGAESDVIAPGDFVVVIREARLRAGEETLAVVKPNTQLRVVRVNDDWICVKYMPTGTSSESMTGWIDRSRLVKRNNHRTTEPAADDSVDSCMKRGVDFVRLVEYDEAIEEFTEVIRLKPSDASAYESRGFVHFFNKCPEKALADFEQALRLAPGNEALREELERLSEMVEQGQEVLELSQGTAKYFRDKDPAKYKKCLRQRFSMQMFLGQLEQAVATCTEAIRADPNCRDALLARGIAYARQRDHTRAIDDLSKVLETEGEAGAATLTEAWQNAQARFYRGVAYRSFGKSDVAIRDFTATINLLTSPPPELDPNDIFKKMRNAEAYSREETTKKNMDKYGRLVLARAYRYRGELYRQSGEASKAKDDLAGFAALAPKLPEITLK